MGTSQQFSLRWNNYLKHITSAFDTLRCDEDLVDVTLSCEGKRIRAHKMLLSACSTYFRDLFKENPCQHPVIIFRNVKFDDLAALVDFIYQGEVNVVQEQLDSFMTTAELLAVQGLTDGTRRDDSVEVTNKNASSQDIRHQNSKILARMSMTTITSRARIPIYCIAVEYDDLMQSFDEPQPHQPLQEQQLQQAQLLPQLEMEQRQPPNPSDAAAVVPSGAAPASRCWPNSSNPKRSPNNQEKGRWVCDVCGKVYARGDSLAHHPHEHAQGNDPVSGLPESAQSHDAHEASLEKSARLGRLELRSNRAADRRRLGRSSSGSSCSNRRCWRWSYQRRDDHRQRDIGYVGDDNDTGWRSSGIDHDECQSHDDDGDEQRSHPLEKQQQRRRRQRSRDSSSTSASAAASSTATSASAPAAAPPSAPTTSASSSTPAATVKEDKAFSAAAATAAAATDSEPVAQVVMQAPGRFSCSLCGSVYKHLASLTQHLEVHRNQTTCVLCHTTLSRKTDLRRHMRLKHNLQWQKSLQRHRAPRKQSNLIIVLLGTSLLFRAQYQVMKPPERTIWKCSIYFANEYYNITHEDSKGTKTKL
ncbi:unnamed protein product [Trichogramma brassicae]|uniref:BTB domain-containing protein n=1 Tax=Trichogramma brassicae TaxID=86971 RepID=A0A6H5J512_9HYME|nr:unnamed protein product [Trichogramma brassicae]